MNKSYFSKSKKANYKANLNIKRGPRKFKYVIYIFKARNNIVKEYGKIEKAFSWFSSNFSV
jgi:hypothetical protein